MVFLKRIYKKNGKRPKSANQGIANQAGDRPEAALTWGLNKSALRKSKN
jgi:hypothetical protein